MNFLVRTKFLDKTLLAVARVAEQSLFSEAYARKQGLLQALDVRVKLVSFLCILVLISVLHAAQMIWVLYIFSLALAASSRIPLGFFMKRVWLFVPLFSAAVVLPAVLQHCHAGRSAAGTGEARAHLFVGPLYDTRRRSTVTRQGLWGGIVLVSRVAASVSFAVLFTLTTKWAEVFSGLRSLFVPRVFVMTLGMTERYLFVFLRLIQDMYRARKSRTIRPLSAGTERNWTASRIGVTFRKSMEMSSDVYNAMLSRGFHGEYRSINRFRVRPVDYVWLAAVIAGGALLLLLERSYPQ